MRKASVLLFSLIVLSISLACQLSAVSSQPLVEFTPILDGDDRAEVLPVMRVRWCEVISDGLNVRGGPSVNWSVKRQLIRGEKVRVTEWFAGWGMIAPAEWVKIRYLKC